MSALVEFQLHNDHFSSERAQLGLFQHIEIIETILNADAKNAKRLLAGHLKTAEETLKGFCVE
jgi:DNA-binding GntR family transcriptional regulator